MPTQSALDPFLPSGHPLHTRILQIEVFQAAAARVYAQATILDLRKCGFVPTGGDLQAAGFIHHMQLAGRIDPDTRILESLDVSQPVVAFEANTATGQESCRDPSGHLQQMVGVRLDHDFVRRLGGVFGGPLGCSHLLTLGQLLGATLPRVLDHEESLAIAGHGPRRVGDRIWRRALFVDGFEPRTGEMLLAIQLTDVASAPHGETQQSPMDRFAMQHEVRVLAHVDLSAMRIAHIEAGERQRTRETLGNLDFVDRSAQLTPLVGASALGGLAKRLLDLVGGAPADRPFLDALLNLAPGLIQCLAALSNRLMGQIAGSSETRAEAFKTAGVGGFPDSCYMWRSGSALARMRAKAESR